MKLVGKICLLEVLAKFYQEEPSNKEDEEKTLQEKMDEVLSFFSSFSYRSLGESKEFVDAFFKAMTSDKKH